MNDGVSADRIGKDNIGKRPADVDPNQLHGFSFRLSPALTTPSLFF
jgi:hypothetical protein